MKNLIQQIEMELTRFLRMVPFHTIFFLYDIEAAPSHLGGTCSDRCLYFKDILQNKFGNKIDLHLHRCSINGKQTHTVLRVIIENKSYIIDVGMGLPINRLLPCDVPIKFSAFGINYRSEINKNILKFYTDMNGCEKELFKLDIRPQNHASVAKAIANRHGDKSCYPFSGGFRYLAIVGDTFVEIKHNNIFDSPTPPQIRKFKSGE